jgi:anthranilate phosphoribosyltransferase
VLSGLLKTVLAHGDLTAEEAAGAMTEIMAGRATAAATAGLLIGLAMKGERPAELVGFATTMRQEAVAFETGGRAVFDTCGTGGDQAGTINISSAAAVVVAACGVPVAKHGNRSVSSRCGSADVLEALGVAVSASPEVAGRCLEEAGIAFLFAPTFHPSLKHAAPTRRDLGVRTAFNLLGPLTNPARPTRQLVGVPRPELTELLARALLMLGSERAWVVHGADGLDELSLSGHTKVSECRDGSVQTFYVHPSDFGMPKAPVETLVGGDAEKNATLIRRVFDGTDGPLRHVVLFNAGAALFIAGHSASVRDGIAAAGRAIDTGAARATLDRLIAVSQGGRPA